MIGVFAIPLAFPSLRQRCSCSNDENRWNVIGAPDLHLCIPCHSSFCLRLLRAEQHCSGRCEQSSLQHCVAWLCPSPTDTQPPAAPSLSFPWEGTEELSRQALACHPVCHLHPFPNLTPPSVSTTTITHPSAHTLFYEQKHFVKMDLLRNRGIITWTTKILSTAVREVQSNTGLYSPIPRRLSVVIVRIWYLPTAAVPPDSCAVSSSSSPNPAHPRNPFCQFAVYTGSSSQFTCFLLFSEYQAESKDTQTERRVSPEGNS